MYEKTSLQKLFSKIISNIAPRCTLHKVITLFNHVGWFHDLGICQLYYVAPRNKVRISCSYSYSQAEFGNLGGNIHYAQELMFIPTLLTRNMVFSQYYSLKIFLIAILSLKIRTLFTICLLFIPTPFTMYRHNSSFVPTSVYSYFLSLFSWR